MRILFLDLDTLRPDHLGCYGYPRNTSPNIDRIAAQGLRFEQYYCSDAPCLPSRVALMTGQFGFHSGVVGHGGTAADLRLEGAERGFRSQLNHTTLPGVLRAAGLHTVFIGGFGERHSIWSFYAGFSEIHDTGKGGMESAEEVTPTVLDWIERNADKDNWYLHVNYWDAHTPYRAPQSFGNPFAGDALSGEQSPSAWITPETLQAHRALAGPHGAQEINMYDSVENPRYPRHPGELRDLDDVRRLFDGYDCGIAYMDSHIGQLMEALQAKGVADDLAIIISSDHGENLGELGIYAEHGTADSITCRIPMIIRWPGGRQGVDHGLHYQLDLLPTVAELIHRPASPRWDGQSYAPALWTGQDCGREALVISQCAHICQRSVRWGNWLYMRTYHDGYRLFPDEMLFDVAADPHLQREIAQENAALVLEGRSILAGWQDEMLGAMPPGCTVDPMRTVLLEGGPFHTRGYLESYLERLRQTGRADKAEQLAQRHAPPKRG